MEDSNKNNTLEIIMIDGERYFKIPDHDRMRPFFMSVVSDSDLWMFISSNGGLTAGRKNAEFALFPYYTDDKITENAENTGSKTIIRYSDGDKTHLWEPFSIRFADNYNIRRNLYKSFYGNKIIFEEINHSLGLTFSYSWNTGSEYGLIRKATLSNTDNTEKKVWILDGIQNVLPFGIHSDLQRNASNLGDAYKRAELHANSGLAIFALSAIIVDKAEPSEALKANIAWSTGLKDPVYLLSTAQLELFRQGRMPETEKDIKGERGAYFIVSACTLAGQAEENWMIVTDANYTQSRVIAMTENIMHNPLMSRLAEEDISRSNTNLIKLVASSDGLQYTADVLSDGRHFSNVLFNIMRGGIFHDNYNIDKKDFIRYFFHANKAAQNANSEILSRLPDVFDYSTLKEMAVNSGDPDFIRLATEYLPLKFSRRHGDPSRPWNKFSINLRNEHDGSVILDYEGNWRDIFQNWEALAYSYPEFIEGMMFRFLNASTFDGYNPYRIMKDGFDWEVIEKDDPWSYIGYWGDHQIIYLQKFLEITDAFYPGKLQEYLESDYFVYAHVPYIIKSYSDIVRNPKDTIDFDHDADKKIRKLREDAGSDGALLRDANGEIYRVNFIEKILASLLAKMSNFIPEGGIWMNTQRPEWNDANNALVGNGVSMVTLYYMRRFLKFLQSAIDKMEAEQIKISGELMEFYHSSRQTLEDNYRLLQSGINDMDRKHITDALGKAASDYRMQIYGSGFWGKKRSISKNGLLRFIQLCLDFTDHSIRANRRSDGLYHAYNIMTYSDRGIHISYLDEMLEGQVAVLSSGFLNAEESAEVLRQLRHSRLFRADQFSYILYPDKNLPGFFEKNIIPKEKAEKSELILTLIKDGNREIAEKDVLGNYHFNGNFRNAADLRSALTTLDKARYGVLTERETELLLEVFEEVFNHKAFTGRSGTFFAFEGLGSIYWHMVSKLLLAAEESLLNATEQNADAQSTEQLFHLFRDIKKGIGVHKSPALYGAFPTDPYSHTPMHKGAQQPGMTGQVKEDILVRIGELGVKVQDGKLTFKPVILCKSEFKNQPASEKYFDVNGVEHNIQIDKNQLFFTFCQVPVIYELSDNEKTEVTFQEGSVQTTSRYVLDENTSKEIFRRSGKVKGIKVWVDQKMLRS